MPALTVTVTFPLASVVALVELKNNHKLALANENFILTKVFGTTEPWLFFTVNTI